MVLLSVPYNIKWEEFKTSFKLGEAAYTCLEKCAVINLYTVAFTGKFSHHVHMEEEKKTCYIALMVL